MRATKTVRLTLPAALFLTLFSLQGAFASQDRSDSDAQQRFERAQQHSQIQSRESSIDRQQSRLNSNQNNVTTGERSLQQQQLRQSQRDLQSEKRDYQQGSSPSGTRTDHDSHGSQ